LPDHDGRVIYDAESVPQRTIHQIDLFSLEQLGANDPAGMIEASDSLEDRPPKCMFPPQTCGRPFKG
jgi:hypothetical protein